MEYKNLYKSRPVSSFKNLSTRLGQILNAERHEKRRECFWGSRAVLNESVSEKSQTVGKKKNSRAEMLLKWKAEKMKKLEEEKKKRKPVFKVGVVQRTVTGSPIIKQPSTNMKTHVGAQQIKPKVNDVEVKTQGVLTRAKAKNMAIKPKIEPASKHVNPFNKCYKFEGGKRKQINSHVFKVPEAVSKLPFCGLTFPCSPKITKSEKLLKIVSYLKEEEEKQTKVDNVELQKEKEIKEIDPKPDHVTPDKVDEDNYVPIYYSPYVTVRSGQKSKRKSKKSLIVDFDEQIKKEENEFKCRIFSFRKYIDCETKRLLATCDKWKHIYQDFLEVPTDVEGDIDSVIGKTNLLTSDKFVQFKGLIDKCENGDPFVKIDDLQGFQDWVSIEVERIDKEFHKLEIRKCNNWKVETTNVDVIKVGKKSVKKVMKKVVGKSNIRSHILAARKLLKEGNGNPGESLLLPTTPNEENLLKKVLTSETKKKNLFSSVKSPIMREKRNSGLEIMVATQKNKFSTPVKKSPRLNDFEILIQKEDVPSKSILKKVPKTNSPKGHVKFKTDNEKTTRRKRGLSEKYFQPLTDEEISPMRTILGDLGNLSVTGMSTRSRTKQLSCSSLMNQQSN